MRRKLVLAGIVLVLLSGWLYAQDAIGWDDSLHEVLDAEPAVGDVFVFQLPPTTARPSAVWGSDIYTSDSSIGWAAVHAGFLNARQGGLVAVEIDPGQNAYTGTTRNGVTSQRYGSWSLSYSFLDPEIAMSGMGGGGIESFEIAWDTSVETLDLGEEVGLDFLVVIPPAARGATPATVWGTDTYTSDSPIAWAAVHAGFIAAASGGTVQVRIVNGLNAYTGSNRNGVRSTNYGPWSWAFQFVR